MPTTRTAPRRAQSASAASSSYGLMGGGSHSFSYSRGTGGTGGDGVKQVVKESIAERQRRIQMLLTGKSDARATDCQDYEDLTEETTDDMTDFENSLNLMELKPVAIQQAPVPVVQEEDDEVEEKEEPEPLILEDDDEELKITKSVIKEERNRGLKEILHFAEECKKETDFDLEESFSSLPPAPNTLKHVPLPARKDVREDRLHKARQRVQQTQADKMAQYQAKLPELMRDERRQLAYQKYLNHGMPGKKQMIKLLEKQNAAEQQITADDIDLLPWMDGDYVVDRAVMK